MKGEIIIPHEAHGASKKFDTEQLYEKQKPEMDKLINWAQEKELMKGKKVLVIGVANKLSLAAGVARVLKASGAELAFNYQNEGTRKFADPIFEETESKYAAPWDVTNQDQAEEFFKGLRNKFGDTLHGVIHSVAGGPKDKSHLSDNISRVPRDVFLNTMDISVYSFIDLAHRVAPMMHPEGKEDFRHILTFGYAGGDGVVTNYGVMGIGKAALKASARALSVDPEVGGKGICVNVVSPGPYESRAASGITGFDELFQRSQEQSPHGNPTMADVARTVLFSMQTPVNGVDIPVDGGASVYKLHISKRHH